MKSRSGFTLIEVMIALLIFALLAAAGVLVLSQSIDNRFVVKAATDRTAELQRLRATLRADLGQAAPRRVRAANGQPAPEDGYAGAYINDIAAEKSDRRSIEIEWHVRPGDDSMRGLGTGLQKELPETSSFSFKVVDVKKPQRR